MSPTDFRNVSIINQHGRSAGAAILVLAYGYHAKLENDPLVKVAEEAMLGFSKASEPGAYMVNRFTWCSYPILFFTAEHRIGLKSDV